MTVTVMITTRNRSDDLKRTLTRLREMNPAPDEIIITADGCTDGTVQMIERDFPSCHLLVNLTSLGSVASRDLMLRAAKSEFVVSLDDDSYPLNLNFFACISSLFSSHPEAAVISFPELRDGDQFASASKTPNCRGHYVSSYANCAAAMRREQYLDKRGFPHFFLHMYEEPDYALQCYDSGESVWFEPSQTIRHHMSPNQREPVRRHHQNARNELWSVWLNCPWPWLVPVSFFRAWRQFCYALSLGPSWCLKEPVWWLSAMLGISHCCRARKAAAWRHYYAWMRLARHPVSDLNTLQQLFSAQTD